MTAFRNFHEGEVRLQTEAGVDTELFDTMVEQAFQPELSNAEVRFVNGRTFSVAATLDDDGRPWASPLFGHPERLFRVVDPTTVRVKPTPADGDPLFDNVATTGNLGVLYFDPSRRRRAKSLGRGTVDGDAIVYRMTRNFGLCNKYIYKRTHEPGAADAPLPPGPTGERRSGLGEADRRQLDESDTVFVASYHTGHGVDATHRGGPAGFVTVVDDRTISLPDYTGNGMFQTLGNLVLDDHIGVTTIDFRTGHTLHITGRGSVAPSPADDIYSTRTLTVRIDEVRISHHQVGTWTDVEAFELRPGLVNPATPYL